jgi:hypothetical protein
MGNLDDTLNRHAKILGIEKQVEAVGVVEKATEVIAKYIPREDFEVISFKDGVLKVGVDNNIVGNELALCSNQILKGLKSIKISRIATVLIKRDVI